MIVLPTREINVWNPSTVDDGEDAPVWTVGASEIPAHISSPGGSVQPGTTASATAVSGVLLCDETPALSAASVVEDPSTGAWYAVDWMRHVAEFGGLGHIIAGLTDREGVQS